MSYYLLPKKTTSIDISPIFSQEEQQPYILPSLQTYLQVMKDQIKTFNDETHPGYNKPYSMDFFQKTVNPYEYIYSTVPGTKMSVSKLKPFSSNYYAFLEIAHTLNLFETMYDRNIYTALSGPNNKSIHDCIHSIRSHFNDVHKEVNIETLSDNSSTLDELQYLHSIDFMYFELEDFQYTKLNLCATFMVKILQYLLNYQSKDGVCILKMQTFVYKPIMDIIYLLTSLYDKVYIIKPNTSNLCKDEVFIVCKQFNFSMDMIINYSKQLFSLYKNLSDANTNINPQSALTSLVQPGLPYYFVNKIEEAAIIFGHQQLEMLELIINLVKNKNRDDKTESLKKTNLQKCIQWCEKYKIPHNKFVEKVNIFLHSVPANIDDTTT